MASLWAGPDTEFMGVHGRKYPPTPADARGSAPGNNTFDSCFGLLPQPAQQQQLLLLRLLLLLILTTTMGFRSYVRHFRGAILGLLRPSEAWCFPAGR